MVNAKDKHHFSDLASFVVRHCGKLVGWKRYPNHEEDTNFLNEKYGTAGGFSLVNMKAEDDFIKDLFVKGSYFSVQTLQLMLSVQKALEQKAAKKEASLDDILKSK